MELGTDFDMDQIDDPLLMPSEGKPASRKRKFYAQKFYRISRLRALILGFVFVFLIAVIAVLATGLVYYHAQFTSPYLKSSAIPACNIDGQSCVAHRQRFKKGAVASDQPMCSEIGNEVLSKRGGNIIDAGIATLVCLSVANLQSAGVGGGGFFVYHDRANNKTHLVNSREKAAAKAFKDMYKHNFDASETGGMAIAIPGEVAGQWAIHSKFGHLPWKELYLPTIKLCEEGFPVGSGLDLAIRNSEKFIMEFEGLQEILMNPKTGAVYKTGDIIKLPKLAKTLERIANGGVHEFYNGTLAQDIVDDIADVKGIITRQDLANFKVEIEKPLSIKLTDGKTMHVVPPPSSGALMALIYNIMNGYKWRTDTLSCQKASVLFHHRLTEAWKYAYSIRYRMGDQDFVDMREILKNVTSPLFAESLRHQINDNQTFPPSHYGPVVEPFEDHGTTHLSVMDQFGNAFAATESVNLYFGSKIVGKRTGIIFDDTMDDFSIPNKTNSFNLPPSKTNFIMPGKRPMSTMCPTIVTDKDGDVIMVAGASGGSKILTATSYVILRTLLLNDDLKNAVDATRIHHQWIPNRLTYEFEIEKFLFDGLQSKGHTMYMQPRTERGAVVQALIREFIQAYCDVRKGGCPAGS